MDSQPSFVSFNADAVQTPIVLSVPHAGRAYPPECAALTRVGIDRLIRLEDRYADQLAQHCSAAGCHVIIAHLPRLWIDLNRAETDVDAQMIDPPLRVPSSVSHKVRSGLGLVPRRLAGVGDIWRAKLSRDDLVARILIAHRPYHAAVSAALAAAQNRFGGALLIDLHSMPPLMTDPPADIVIGDRFGRSADARMAEVTRAICESAGFRVALNTPYPGGYLIERHGRPVHNIHALQLEVDRRLYLDDALTEPGYGLEKIQALILSVARGLAAEIRSSNYAEAVE